jgi:uncharacterized protein
MKATPDEQRQLLTLADTDEEIRRLQHKRANLPEQQALDAEVQTHELVTGELVDATQTQERLTAQATRHEREIETVDLGRKTKEASIYAGQIATERALEATREEIQAMFRRKGDLEDSLLEIMEQLEDVSSLVDELTTRRRALDEQIAELTTARDSAATDIDAELAELSARRDAEAATVPDGIVAAYDSLRSKRKGRAVARLQGRTCTGCMLELTAIELEEIKETASEGLAYCQQCGSIIIAA